MERIRRITPCPETFSRPAEFNLEKYLEGSLGLFRGKPARVRLRFSRDVARYVVERQWHPTQRNEPLLTGELEVTLHVAPELDVKRWILSYGKDVEVLEPRKLRDEVRAEWLAALRGRAGRLDKVTLATPAARSRPGRGRAAATAYGARLRASGAGAPSRKA